jgi:DNA repair exonuclease SbcCD ATPase subunit
MIKLESISIRNFLSIGNVPQVLDLANNGLTLILGENMDVGGNNSRNGTGKSSIVQAISFALYGSPISKIKIDNLVNTINAKNMFVELLFSIGETKYKIQRGRKPQILKFFIDGGLVTDPDADNSQGDSRRTQEHIESIIGMSHDLFKHLVALNTYTPPFLQMKLADQRNTIEELLGITQLSTRSEKLKENIKMTKDDIKSEEFRIRATTESNETMQKAIDDMIKRSDKWENTRNHNIRIATEDIESLSAINIDTEISNHRKLDDYKALVSELNRLNKDKTRHEKEINTKAVRYEKYLNQLEIVKNHKCHSCGQDIHDASHQEQIESISASISKVEAELLEHDAELKSIVSAIEDISSGIDEMGGKPEVFYSDISEALSHQNILSNLEETIAKENSSVNPYTDQIEQLKSEGIKEIDYELLNGFQSRLRHQEFLLRLLSSKDSFIRKKIIEQNINHLNHRLNGYLDTLGLPHEVAFQSDLSVEISLLGKDFDFEQLSRGEMNRVIIATSWAFRDIWENLNQPINLMFIDEIIDNGTDAQGAEAALNSLKFMVRERNKNIFLISHKEELVGRVNSILKVKKENSFTTFDINPEDMN